MDVFPQPSDPVAAPAPLPATGYVRRAVLAAGAALAGAVVLRVLTTTSDEVSVIEAKHRAAVLEAAQPLQIDLVTPAQMDAAVRSLALAPSDEAAMRRDIMAGTQRLAWLSLFDSDAEDGDVVTIESAGLQHTMLLTKRPVQVALCLPASGRITLVGVDQGRGGGVTVGIVAGAQTYKLPPMAVGDSLSLAVAAP
ncbi:MAG: hypothetical protein ACRYHQ_29930 [Janthinobacterium lividum]